MSSIANKGNTPENYTSTTPEFLVSPDQGACSQDQATEPVTRTTPEAPTVKDNKTSNSAKSKVLSSSFWLGFCFGIVLVVAISTKSLILTSLIVVYLAIEIKNYSFADSKFNKAKEVASVAAVKADEKKPEAQAPAQGSARDAVDAQKAQTPAQDVGTPGNK